VFACTSQSGRAPVITIFDHRGSYRDVPNKEYHGPKAGGGDDEMCVKVALPIIQVSGAQSTAQVTLRSPLSPFQVLWVRRSCNPADLFHGTGRIFMRLIFSIVSCECL
jgi:hypothetical protein